MTDERDVERRLTAAARARGGLCLKLAGTGVAGMPDRLVLLPGGRCAFVEVKRPGARPRALQVRRLKALQGLGYPAFVLDSPEAVEGLLDRIGNGAAGAGKESEGVNEI